MISANDRIQEPIDYEIKNENNSYYKIQFNLFSEKIEISVLEKSVLPEAFKVCLNLENFKTINNVFKQFDNLTDMFEYLKDLENISEKTSLIIENKFAKLTIKLPPILKSNPNNDMIIQLPKDDIKESDLIVKLCQQVKKIDILEKKINFLFRCVGKTEKEFEIYESLANKHYIFNLDGSSIVSNEDFSLISEGINQVLNKNISNISLLYRGTRDGDNSRNFHSKCDNIQNTVTFVKSKNGRRFGVFTNIGIKSNFSGNYKVTDPKTFIFSLDNHECYFYKSGNTMCACSNILHFLDLSLQEGCLSGSKASISQQSCDYKGKKNALNELTSFQVEDFETYELILI